VQLEWWPRVRPDLRTGWGNRRSTINFIDDAMSMIILSHAARK
jgi:hypothetical protein